MENLGSSHGTTSDFAVGALCDTRHGRPEQRPIKALDVRVTVSPEGKLLDALRSATDYMFDECAPQRTKGQLDDAVKRAHLDLQRLR